MSVRYRYTPVDNHPKTHVPSRVEGQTSEGADVQGNTFKDSVAMLLGVLSSEGYVEFSVFGTCFP